MEYKNSQTTSTKCQYQAAHSNPTIWFEELIMFLKRIIEIKRNVDPIRKWIPWNPVAIKNVAPKAESAIEKGASMYSNPCSIENNIPKKIVSFSLSFDLLKFFFNISWWDHVTVTPEDSSRMVFNSGILIGLKELIEVGGQCCPNSMFGEILLWKNPQKNEMKKKISDVINKIIPVFSPFITMEECTPWNEASRWMSRHHV